MEKIICIKDLQDLGFLGCEYAKLDLYDAFMMYLISKGKPANERIVLKDGDSILDSERCFEIKNWMF